MFVSLIPGRLYRAATQAASGGKTAPPIMTAVSNTSREDPDKWDNILVSNNQKLFVTRCEPDVSHYICCRRAAA